jgi:hypothetical protein
VELILLQGQVLLLLIVGGGTQWWHEDCWPHITYNKQIIFYYLGDHQNYNKTLLWNCLSPTHMTRYYLWVYIHQAQSTGRCPWSQYRRLIATCHYFCTENLWKGSGSDALKCKLQKLSTTRLTH